SVNEEGRNQPGQAYAMDLSTGRRTQLTDDDYYNTDPALSPDSRFLAVSSYRGDDRPKPGSEERLKANAFNWRLVVRDLRNGTERELTAGKERCLSQWITPCAANEGVGWAPQWTPDGKEIGYISIRGAFATGLYVIGAD